MVNSNPVPHAGGCLEGGDCFCIGGEQLKSSWKAKYVVLSMIIAVIGAYTAFNIVVHARYCSHAIWYYALVALAGLTLGFQTIWGMHFVGMGALELTLPEDILFENPLTMEVRYNTTLTIVSIIAAWILSCSSILVVTGGLARQKDHRDAQLAARILIAAPLLAIGVCVMHYTGMASMTGHFHLEYNSNWVIFSCTLAFIVAAVGLLLLVRSPASLLHRCLASVVIGLAATGMHYAGMAGVTYSCKHDISRVMGSDGHSSNPETVALVALVANFIIGIVPNEYGEDQRRQWEQRVHAEHAKQIQADLEISEKVAEALVHYDLDAAESMLTGGASTSHEPLMELLKNLTVYRPFLPHALFDSNMPDSAGLFPNLSKCINNQQTSQGDLAVAVARIRDPRYTITEFHIDVSEAFPELQLYMVGDITSSGNTGTEEYLRTLGAFFTLFAMYRLDIDGKEIISFGVDETGYARGEACGEFAEKKTKFYTSMDWDMLIALMVRAGLLLRKEDGELAVNSGRTIAMLTLTAIHDIMKIKLLQPIVQPEHAPYHGFVEGDEINDHDLALAYILENYPPLLPSFACLKPAQRAPVLFTQAKMNFNNGWLVQGEAPPGIMLKTFKQVIDRGGVSASDVSFYFVHWITDLAGADPHAVALWPGATKITSKLPNHVFTAFLKSFEYVEKLAVMSEVQVVESYLCDRFNELGLQWNNEHEKIAVMRLALMAQGFEGRIGEAFEALPVCDKQVLVDELARTGCAKQFTVAPPAVKKKSQGPAILLYYSPAIIQKAGTRNIESALMLLAAVFRAARQLYPLDKRAADQTCTVHLDAMKAVNLFDMETATWVVRQTASHTAEVAMVDPCSLMSSTSLLLSSGPCGSSEGGFDGPRQVLVTITGEGQVCHV